MEPIYYHEDFYRQIELIPEENYFSTNKYINDLPLTEGSKYGIYNIVERKEQKVKTIDRNIPLSGIKKLLNPLSLFYSDQVQSGYSTAVYNVENTVVWGFERYGIFVECNDSYAKNIWLCNSAKFSKENTGKFLAKALKSIGEYYALILVDWNKELVVKLDSEQIILDYLNQNLAFNR